MPSYVTPQRGAAFVFHTALTSQADTMLQQVNPTLAAGDCQVSKDAGAFANLTTLPDVQPAGGASVRVQLSAAEMTADNVVVRFSDQAGAEWCDQSIMIQTTAQQIDDLATGAEIGALETHGDATWATATGFAVAGDEMALTGATFTSIAAAVWDRLTTALTTAGSVGAYLLSKLGLLGTGSATVAVPVTATGNVTSVEGDDYKLADGRALEWTITTSADMTGGTAAVIIHGVTAFTATVSMLDATTAFVRLELTRVQTAALGSRNATWDYSVIGTQAAGLGSDVITLLRGRWTHTARHVAP